MKISELSTDERSALIRLLAAEQKAEKRKRKQDIKAFKELTADYVNKHIDRLIEHHNGTDDLIKLLFSDYNAVLALKEDLYGEKVNNQDSHTSTLEDGSASITIGYNVSIGFDGTETAGIEKIKSFLASLADEALNVKKLAKAVNTLLKPLGKTGMLNPASIIQLSKLREEFNDAQFDDGLDIIVNAQQRRQNSMFVSGWKFIEIVGMKKKLEFRFTI